MDTAKFTQNPLKATCRCLICRENDVEASDEHIIPKALGGMMHTWDVCKTCNSKLGELVDSPLNNHSLITLNRHVHSLRGQSGQRPKTVLEGTFTGDDGHRYRLEFDNGVLTPHKLPEISHSDAGIHLSIDPRDLPKVDEIIGRYCRRHNLKTDPTTRKTSQVVESPSQHFNIPVSIDIAGFRLALVKIAYEFAATLFPELLDDPEMTHIAGVLHRADHARIDELDASGAFHDIFPQMFGSMIDLSQKTRHYIALINLDGKLYCCVRLFSLMFMVVKLSDSPLRQPYMPIIAINDFGKHNLELYNIAELAKKTSRYLYTTYIFTGETDERPRPDVALATDMHGHLMLFTPKGQPIGNIKYVLSCMPEEMVETAIDLSGPDEISITSYKIDGNAGFVTADGQIMLIDRIISRSAIQKI